MLSPSRAGSHLGCCEEEFTTDHFSPHPGWRRHTEVDYPEAHKTSLKGWQSEGGPRVRALVHLLVNHKEETCCPRGLRPQRGSAEGLAGVAPASGSEWECGPAHGRNSSSPQASGTPQSSLSGPRTEGAREVEGAGRESRRYGSEGACGTPWASVFLLATFTPSTPRAQLGRVPGL